MPRVRGNKTLRFLDRYVGVPAAWTLGLRPRREMPAPDSIRRVGLMKTVAIGDMVLLSGLVADARATFPNARIILVGGEDNHEIGRLMSVPPDEICVVNPGRPLQSLRSIRAARLDLLIDCGAWPRFDAILSALSGARFTLGFRVPSQARHYAYDAVVDYRDGCHEVDNNRRLAAAAGVDCDSPPRLTARGHARVEHDRYAVFHAWPGGYMSHVREWPVERWVELGANLAAREYAVVLTGGRGDTARSRALADSMAAKGAMVIDAAGRYSVSELGDVLAGARLTVSVNSGVMHMSAALGTPTIGLQGPTSSVRWGPLGPRVRAVDSIMPGCGFLHLGWEYAGQRLDCMQGISIAQVMAAVDSLLGS